MAKVEVSFALIFCFLSLCSLASSPAALAAPLKDAAKKDGDGFETLGKKAGLVRHLCNETGHYNLCVAAVEADPRSNLKSHRKGILHIVMDKTISNATAILEYIDRLLADNTTKMENTTRDSLEGCSSGYQDSIYNLKHALSLLELKNVSQFFELRSMLNFMYGTPFDCDQSFVERPIPAPNPLTAIFVVDAKTAGKANGGCSERVRDQLCHYTGHYDVCVAAINANLLNDPHTDADTRDSLKACASVYPPAVHDLKNDLRLIGFKNYQEYYRLRTDVDVLESCPYGCERSFMQRPKPARSPLTSINNYIQKLTGSVMMTMDFIYHNLSKGY